MPQGYIKEDISVLSDLYLPGKLSNSLVLQSVILVSFMESKRTLVVPGRSLGGFGPNGCSKDTSRTLHINFEFSTLLGSAPSPMCFQSLIMECKRTLEVPERSPRGC